MTKKQVEHNQAQTEASCDILKIHIKALEKAICRYGGKCMTCKLFKTECLNNHCGIGCKEWQFDEAQFTI